MSAMPTTPKKGEIEEDEIVGKLIPAGEEGSEAILLTGFLGRGRRDGCWRLYKAPELREYVEFEEDDVVHCEKTDSNLLPARASLVWLKSDALLKHQTARSRGLAAEFLSGQIVADQRVAGVVGTLFVVADVTTWMVTATAAAGVPTTPPTTHGAPTQIDAPLCRLVALP